MTPRRLDREEIEEVRRRYREGESVDELAEVFDCDDETARHAVRGHYAREDEDLLEG